MLEVFPVTPCMCGDLCCPSCGPAQGNWRCPICRAWKSEACEHISRRTGELKRQYRKQAEEQARAEAQAEAEAYLDSDLTQYWT